MRRTTFRSINSIAAGSAAAATSAQFELNDTLTLTAGAETRYDDIGNVGLQHTEAGSVVEDISRHRRDRELGRRVLGSAVAAARSAARDGGLRADYYDFDVTRAHARRRRRFGRATARCRRSSPPRIASIRTIELYGNWGRGFHSNDARGVVNTATPVQGLSKGAGEEVGARFELGTLQHHDDVLVAGARQRAEVRRRLELRRARRGDAPARL